MRRSLLRLGVWPLGELPALVARIDLRRAWRWLVLPAGVGIAGGLAALVFKWSADHLVLLFWGLIVRFIPTAPSGEPFPYAEAGGSPWPPGLLIAPALGGLLAGLLIFLIAPEAEGHGTDAAIRAFHRDRGRIRARIPLVKLVASAFTLASGGSAGREGPIAQIGAGAGSLLGGALRLPDRDRRMLLAAGIAAGIGAIFRAPLAGALFAAEVLYSEPDFEADVVVPSLVASIVGYSLFSSVHGFGHIFGGTRGFAYHDPRSLGPYAVLGLVSALGAIAFVEAFQVARARFHRLRLPAVAKPVLGGALTGAVGLAALAATSDPRALAVMGSGYGFLQSAVAERGEVGPALGLLVAVALGKMATTSLTIGSGGSGGVFGPSMVIGGSLGAATGTIFHELMPGVVPNVGPFTIVGMAGFFAGAANTPISTILMVGDLTGNYSLLIPAMLVVSISYLLARGWTLYEEQVRTRAESPAHHGEVVEDVLASLTVGDVYNRGRPLLAVHRSTSVDDAHERIEASEQYLLPVVDDADRLIGSLTRDDLLARPPGEGARAVGDLLEPDVLAVEDTDTLDLALDMMALLRLDALPVVAAKDGRRLLGLLTHADVVAAYRRRVAAVGNGEGRESSP